MAETNGSQPEYETTLRKEANRLFLEPHPSNHWQFREAEDWSELQSLLTIAQQTRTPLWMSKGPSPGEKEGFLVRMSPTTSLPPPRLDRSSLLLHCDTRHSLETIESFARVEGLTAGFRPHPVKSLLEWTQQSYVTVMDTCSGEPVSRMVGCEALLPDGMPLRLGKAPHAAVGPDLKTLFWGTCGVLGVLTRVTLRLRRVSESMTFWKLRFSDWSDMTAFVQRMVRARQYPVDARAEWLTDNQEVSLTLRVNPLQTPLTQRLCQHHPESRELLASHFGQPRPKALWVRIDAPWSSIGKLPEVVSETSPFDVLSFSLVHLTHEQGVVLLELSQPAPSSSLREELSDWAFRLRARGMTCKGDNRLFHWTRLHRYRGTILKRIKQELDPAFTLNPHLFVEDP